MNKRFPIELIVPSFILLFIFSGCVSTTTGSITEPVRDDENAAEINYQLGARYYQQGSYELARDRLILATQIDPKMAIAYSTLALTYEALENLRLAKDAYRKAVRADSQNIDVQNTYAVFLCRQKEFSEAAKHFDKAIGHPENDSAQISMTNAGLCMLENDDYVAAEAYFRAALDRKNNYGEALIQLCLMKYREEDYLSARAFLQRFMSSNVSSPSVLYLASKIEDMLGNDRGRSEYEDQLIREHPTSPEARKVLGTG